MKSRQSSITPEKQMISKIHTDPELQGLDDVDCSPKTKDRLHSLKRKASEILDQGSPSTTSPFLKWRLAVVESQLRIRSAQQQAVTESNSPNKTIKMDTLKKDKKALLTEKFFLLSQRKIIEGDLNDIVANKEQLTQAYIAEHRMSLDAASSSKDKLSSLKSPRMDRKLFRHTVNEYLGTEKTGEDELSVLRWCNVLGYWLSPNLIKCAHIVPFSWDTKHMGHMFGSDEPPLTSKRNGLSLQSKIEEAFDNCWIVIVPMTSVEVIPTEWKLVLLNPFIEDKILFDDIYGFTDKKLWRWRDVDGRQLKFLNDHRPARRFLYMRYTLAWLHAEDKKWPNFKEKVPPGEVWASPNKPDGYLRKSILLDLGKSTGDRLPQDLMAAGSFEDPETSSSLHDEMAGMEVIEHVQNHLDGIRDDKLKEDESEEESEEDVFD